MAEMKPRAKRRAMEGGNVTPGRNSQITPPASDGENEPLGPPSDMSELFSDYDAGGMVSPQKQRDAAAENSPPAAPQLRHTDEGTPAPLIFVQASSARYGAQASTQARRAFKRPAFVVQRPGEAPPAKKSTIDAPPASLGMLRRASQRPARALHDPDAPDAIVVYAPPVETAEQALGALKAARLGDQSAKPVHVVVDPLLARRLRPHQVEGVQFLYDCVTGRKAPGARGCIIADEMGLGKTLQCITLLWTLLRQSPVAGRPTVQKAVIVCPSSLVRNWAHELAKWLGAGRVQALVCDGRAAAGEMARSLAAFAQARGRAIVQPVLIASYETLRQHASTLAGAADVGLLLADEGHRLKSRASQTYQALYELDVPRRVIMSGTPIQNDLGEYFSLLDFTNPGLLGTEREFHRAFEVPILRGRDALATPEERRTADQRLEALYDVANRFILRRTAELLTRYLPVKYEHVVFCRLSPEQRDGYERLLASAPVQRLLAGADSQPLRAIGMLRKLCNHPSLLSPEEQALAGISSDAPSGKLVLVERLLELTRSRGEKVVLISNFCQTLDVLHALCQRRRWPCVRLDGSLSAARRQAAVDRFNAPTTPEFVFLLSSKAGGCGINLIGASRLVLYDPDWNPACDLQALARIWREGQRRQCFVYRLVGTGTIEEKVLMRQAHKQSLSSAVVDEEAGAARHFTLSDLRNLFRLLPDTLCEMHDVLKCRRCVRNRQTLAPPSGAVGTGAQAQDMSSWDHFSELELHRLHDGVLRTAARDASVSFVFQCQSHNPVSLGDSR